MTNEDGTNTYGHKIIDPDTYMAQIGPGTKCRIDVTVDGSKGRRVAFRNHPAHRGVHNGEQGFFAVLERGPGVFIPASDGKVVE